MVKRARLPLFLAFLLVSASAWADPGPERKRPWLVSVSANYGSWDTSDLDYDGHQYLGFTQVSYATPAWGAAVTGYYAGASYDMTEEEDRFNLNTVGDTSVSTYYQRKKNALTFRGGVDFNIPTGKASYTEEELQLIFTDDLSEDLMTINTYGTGANVTPHMVLSYNFGRFVAGAGFNYEFSGEYESITGDPESKYNPGDRFTGLLNGAYIVSKKSYLLLTFLYSRSGEDAKNGEKVYREGDLYSLEARYLAQWIDRLNTVISFNVKSQGKNQLLNEDSVLTSETGNTNNNSFELFVNNVYRYGRRVALMGLVGYKAVQANGYSEEDTLYDAGRSKYYIEPGISLYFSERMYLTLRGRYSVVSDKADAASAADATYTVLNADVSLAYSF